MSKDIKISLKYNNKKTNTLSGDVRALNIALDCGAETEYVGGIGDEYQNDYELLVLIKNALTKFQDIDAVRELNIIKPENFKMSEECVGLLKNCRSLTSLLKASHNVNKNNPTAIRFLLGELNKMELFEEGKLAVKQKFVKERDLISILPDICINYNIWDLSKVIKITGSFGNKNSKLIKTLEEKRNRLVKEYTKRDNIFGVDFVGRS